MDHHRHHSFDKAKRSGGLLIEYRVDDLHLEKVIPGTQ
jgi:hypothetical protein